MKMKEVFRNEHFKVLDVSLDLGEAMPLHKASSDAYVICKKGKGKISFSDRDVVISHGESVLIKAEEPHQLEVLESFNSSIILEPSAEISFVKKEEKTEKSMHV